jgi:bifunctional DNA-binding transcriptional regulator/antitoxin component of YhaV-PrlF toxin-antitoxin module
MQILEEVRTVTADGRVVIPWVIQRALGLDHGGPIRFRVEGGVVTVCAVDARKPDAPRVPDGTQDSTRPQRTDIRAALATELRTLLDAAERDRANRVLAE